MQQSRDTLASPTTCWGDEPHDLGAMSCQRNCHIWDLWWTSVWPHSIWLYHVLEGGHRTSTDSWVGWRSHRTYGKIRLKCLHQVEACRSFPLSSCVVLRGPQAELVDSSPHQKANKGKALYLMGDWYQWEWEWEIGWTKLFAVRLS